MITTSGEGYTIFNGRWISAGFVPGATSGVNVEPTTWGQLKNKYQEEDK